MLALPNAAGGLTATEELKLNGTALNFTNAAGVDYYGVYNVMEKIRRGSERIDMTDLDTYDNAAGAAKRFIRLKITIP